MLLLEWWQLLGSWRGDCCSPCLGGAPSMGVWVSPLLSSFPWGISAWKSRKLEGEKCLCELINKLLGS